VLTCVHTWGQDKGESSVGKTQWTQSRKSRAATAPAGEAHSWAPAGCSELGGKQGGNSQPKETQLDSSGDPAGVHARQTFRHQKKTRKNVPSEWKKTEKKNGAQLAKHPRVESGGGETQLPRELPPALQKVSKGGKDRKGMH